ncbi:hypothetical protein [Cobetia marina]|uniref:PIN-like domain-containing protein n=1 Tax=Cobetia marina TaxID=28258 RepID=UPI00174AECBD
MQIFIDENISPALAAAMNHLQKLLNENHTFVHATEKFERGTPDQEWLETLKAEGNWAILSKDKFDKGAPEKIVFRSSGLTVINLDKKWSKKDGWTIACQLLKWWPDLSKNLISSQSACWYEVPFGYTPNLKGERMSLAK